MKVFPIYETELDTLSSFNDLSLACFSMGSWFLSLAYDTFKIPEDVTFYEFYKAFPWHLIIPTLILYSIGTINWYKKRGIVNRIKAEAKICDPTNSSLLIKG